MNFTVTVEAPIPPDRLWQIITDVELSPEIKDDVVAVERLDSGDGFEVGTRWKETRAAMRFENTEVKEVTALVPNHSFTVETDSRGSRYWSTTTIAPAPGGSTLRWDFTAEPKGLGSRILANTLGRALARSIKRAAEEDLLDVVSAAVRLGRDG